MFLTFIAALPVAIWTYLLTARAGYWQTHKHLLPPVASHPKAPTVVAIVPARNEADVIGECLRSLLPIRTVLVDDGSMDGTADAARAMADGTGNSDRLTVIEGKPLPLGWTGKLWAVSQGVAAATQFAPDYLLFTDADIHHAPGSIDRLLRFAHADQLHLASVMVRLSTATLAEQLLIPAFVYFFFQLYPPDYVASASHSVAGAAGGCLLIRASTLDEIGGIESIAGEVIDDCALARQVKSRGHRIWMGLGTNTVSVRSYGSFSGVERMIARSAFNQLRHSGVLLVLTLAGLFITYLLPPLLLLSKSKKRKVLGAIAWTNMTVTYLPTVSFYRQPQVTALTLPAVALFYAAATAHSALLYWTGKGGQWKGRIQDTK